jgi:hypothetical protein
MKKKITPKIIQIALLLLFFLPKVPLLKCAFTKFVTVKMRWDKINNNYKKMLKLK